MHQAGLMHFFSMSASPAELTAPASLSLVGHPLRWQLLVNLARGDHTVHELTALVEQPQNLLSYHLGKLRNAGLVSARRSTADGRDAFYAADLTRVGGLLDAAGSGPSSGSLPCSPIRGDGEKPSLGQCDDPGGAGATVVPVYG